MSDETESPQVQEAIDVMAQYAIWRQFDVENILWEDYPELGEYDFTRMVEAAERLQPKCPDLHERRDSYEYLSNRADSE